ncbi:endoribonuclease L-PSP [Clostridium carboxidivorans P7]|uniref:Endoribonuclease L-PSP n=1 Tax=Clostridium carboxidivorans P7 TaxID=536227 RepID=C6PX50_9CLOT|nr:RidA family protein [Clostridium carboxidivorans]AKN32728.1 endoribonuclease L-PSP [Clostridium carboxidivorans P7]EET86167.1 endoribonuclease L-PSP [Clostridium carboxidivorans P7]EFG90034.1 putative endoribonuclease L-PSP [Clostridium carboxidivorans P7]
MKKIINTKNAPAAIGPYVQGYETEDLVITSGQLGINIKTGKLAEGIEAQTKASMKNVGEILKEAGLSYNNIIKTTIFVQDLSDFAVVNETYSKYFQGQYPARSCIQVAKLPLNGLVEIECIALKK